MASDKMHDDEVEIAIPLVRQLLAEQFPQWAAFPIEPVHSAGTDNAMVRLGDDMVVRLPRIHEAAARLDNEQQWLPKLAKNLPLAVPVPLAKGKPGAGYPWNWSVYRWLEGENATSDRIPDLSQTATALAHFIAATQRIDPTGGPTPGPQNSYWGEPLALRDLETREAIEALHGVIDTKAATAAWEVALHAPAWNSPPVWIHGDLQSGNLLVQHGQLTAVIDFGCLGVGDPACDLQVAWNLFSSEARNSFCAALPVDDATWARGRGWALSIALIALPYYQKSNPAIAAVSQHTINEVLADF